jgi:hypothetical protein
MARHMWMESKHVVDYLVYDKKEPISMGKYICAYCGAEVIQVDANSNSVYIPPCLSRR